jgi:hypothetical protein
MGGMISFLDLILANLDAVPRVVSKAHPLPVTNIPSIGGGPSNAFRLPSSTASNNAASIKAGPGVIFGITGMVTTGAAAVYLKLFDTAGIPNPAVDIPAYVFGLTFAGGPTGQFSFPQPNGLDFLLGIGLALVRGPLDGNNTPINAAQVLALNITFV